MASISADSNPQAQGKFFETQRGRAILENLTAYLFLAPAALVIFTFGIFPVGFAFFVSMHKWRRLAEEWEGLDNYVEALGNVAFVLFFWLAVGALVYGAYRLWTWLQASREERVALTYIVPGVAIVAAIIAVVVWFFRLLPIVLEAPVRLRGTLITRESFINEFFASFTYPQVTSVASIMLVLLAVASVLTIVWWRQMPAKHASDYLIMIVTGGVLLVLGAWLMNMTLSEINLAIAEARADGEPIPIWSNIIFISAGTALLGLAVWLWNRTVHDHAHRQTLARLFAVVVAVVGGVFLIRELPIAFAQADDDVLRAFNVTVMYSVFSVPLQLTLGLLIAILLFQNIKGQSFFRVVYFLPYITPFVATSVVFSLIFGPSDNSPINQLMLSLGVEPQNWLREPQGIIELIVGEDRLIALFGERVAAWIVGPSLALMVIIFYNVWIYAGYSAVIFLAGLGSIPTDVYEAARIDGANRWHQFRHITLPLLSPTTFFLILISTIGTFQAFTQIFLMRRPGAYDAVDTINLEIYGEITSGTPDYAYGSAMAFVLFAVILTLTLIQNRVVGSRVFYG